MSIKHHLESLLQEKGWGETLPRSQERSPRVFPTGRPELDLLLRGGLPRGHISEITGGCSSGKTRFLLSLIAHATQQKEVVAWIDANALDPASAERVGVDLARLLWVRCSEPRMILKAADILCRAGNFGMIVLDLTPGTAPRGGPASLEERARESSSLRVCDSPVCTAATGNPPAGNSGGQQ